MEIVRNQKEDYLELVVAGRLDGYWAQHLTTSVGDVMREGTHAVRLNLESTTYISSAGIGVLVDLHRQFTAVNGSFIVTNPSRAVSKVLEMVGLAAMLTTMAPAASPAAATAAAPAREVERRQAGGAIFEIHDVLPGAQLTCRVMGRPELLGTSSFGPDDCREIAAAEDRVALGLGAFGDGFAGSRDRFGEFLAIAGGAASQPTDGTNFPDYMLGSGTFVPRLSALYGLCCDGGFSKLVRFESADRVGLSAIADVCLDVAGAATACVVMLAESAGLMGATLKRSPVAGERVFGFPGVRQWLSFSAERCFAHSLALVAGVVSVDPPQELRPFVRPLTKGANRSGHFHAAAFGYRPLQKGNIEMKSTVRELFEAGGLQGVLHLLADEREIAGAGESEFLRGACWVGPVKEVKREVAL